MIFKKWPAKRF